MTDSTVMSAEAGGLELASNDEMAPVLLVLLLFIAETDRVPSASILPEACTNTCCTRELASAASAKALIPARVM